MNAASVLQQERTTYLSFRSIWVHSRYDLSSRKAVADCFSVFLFSFNWLCIRLLGLLTCPIDTSLPLLFCYHVRFVVVFNWTTLYFFLACNLLYIVYSLTILQFLPIDDQVIDDFIETKRFWREEKCMIPVCHPFYNEK